MTWTPTAAAATGNAFRAGWDLMSRQERRRAILLATGIIGIGLVDAVALMSVLPVVHLITDPAGLETNRWLGELHRIFGSPPVHQFFPLLAAGSLALLFISSLLRLLSEYVTFRMAAACQARLSGELLMGALDASYDWTLRQSPTKLTRLVQNDTSLWANSFVRRVGIIANAWVTGFVAVGLVVLFSPGPILIVLAVMAALAWITLQLTKPTIGRLSIRHRDASERIAVIAHQALSGMKDVKMTNSANSMLRLFSRAVAEFGHAVSVNNSLRQLPSTLIMFLAQAALIVVTLVLWWSGTQSGDIASQVALLALASSRLIPAMNRLSAGAGVLWDALPYMHGIVALKDEIEKARVSAAEDDRPPVPAEWHRITFDDLSYRYPSASEPTLRGLDFVLERGKAYGVVGPSGAGKSTLVDVLAGLLVPERGRVAIDGTPLLGLSSSSWRGRIGYVSQTPFMLDDSLRANVAFGVPPEKIDDALVWECLRQAHLEDVTLELEHGLDTGLGDRGLRLSGGQRQRIAIARALYKRPQLMVLDEATSALDTLSERAVQDALLEIHGKITVVSIAHRLSTVQACDCIFLMEHGSIVARGTFEYLQRESALFRRMASGPESA